MISSHEGSGSSVRMSAPTTVFSIAMRGLAAAAHVGGCSGLRMSARAETIGLFAAGCAAALFTVAAFGGGAAGGGSRGLRLHWRGERLNVPIAGRQLAVRSFKGAAGLS